MKAILLLCLLLAAVPAYADPYFNSAETKDANTLMSDDFEDGAWYKLNCDKANAAGGIASQTKGWCGTIYAEPITPTNGVDCNNAGANGSRCAATSGVLGGGQGGKNMADHGFTGGQEVQELYFRYYRKNSAGYSYSGQKVLSFNKCCAGGAGIYWAGLGFNIGQGSASTNAPDIGITNNHASNVIWRQNVNPISMTSGEWYYVEVHIKLNTPGQANGVYELWADRCPGGKCTGTPTLRARHTNVPWGKDASNGGIGAVWLENWANNGSGQGSKGQEWYDNIKASKTFNGFVGATSPTPPPPDPTPTPTPTPTPGNLTLAITKAGTGQGTVVSGPAGLSCGLTCSAAFAPNTSLTLTATASAGSAFAGWSMGGSAPDTSCNPCTFTLAAAATITATFTAVTPPPPPPPPPTPFVCPSGSVCLTTGGTVYVNGVKVP